MILKQNALKLKMNENLKKTENFKMIKIRNDFEAKCPKLKGKGK